MTVAVVKESRQRRPGGRRRRRRRRQHSEQGCMPRIFVEHTSDVELENSLEEGFHLRNCAWSKLPG